MLTNSIRAKLWSLRHPRMTRTIRRRIRGEPPPAPSPYPPVRVLIIASLGQGWVVWGLVLVLTHRLLVRV